MTLQQRQAAKNAGDAKMKPTLDRREVLSGLAATAGLAAMPATAATADQVSFLVIGDWGRRGTNHQRDVAVQMDKAAAEYGTRFTVSVGDNFYDDGVQSTSDTHWRESFEDIYSGNHLQSPWYVALGNHDYRGLPQAQVDYTSKSGRWRMPSRYFKVAGADIGFPAADLFIIDTSPLVAKYGDSTKTADEVHSQDPKAQLAWLDHELGASTADTKLVFGHHTMFSGGSGHGDTAEIIANVLPILKQHGVKAYINGHDHDLQHIQRDGLDIICTGAGSEVRPVREVPGTRFCASQSGFSILTLTPSSMHLEFRDYLGQTLYSAAI